MIRSIQRCDEGSDMHTDLTFTLELVEELGRLKLADALAEAVDIGTQAPVRGGQRGGSRGGGHRGGGQAGHSRTTELGPIYEEGNESGAEEAWVGTDWVLSDDDGRTPRCTSGDGAGHPIASIIRALFQPTLHPMVLARTIRALLVYRPQFSVDLPMMVDAYLSPHQACPPHL